MTICSGKYRTPLMGERSDAFITIDHAVQMVRRGEHGWRCHHQPIRKIDPWLLL
jgi:hypothetical protein